MWLASLILTFCALNSNAQEARVVEKLSDGSFIVSIDGTEYRAISSEQVRTAQTRKVELEACQADSKLLTAEKDALSRALELSKRDAQLADTTARLQFERAEKFRAMFEGEQALRLQAENLIKPNRVTNFFNNPYVQIGTKILVPVVQTLITRR